MMMMMMMTDDNGGDDDVDDDDDKDCLLQMGRFRGVASSLCFKARLSAKLVIGKKLIFTTKVSHLASFSK